MTSSNPNSLSEVLYTFAVLSETPDPAVLDRFVRQYPQYADELTDLAIELALDSDGDADVQTMESPEEAVSPAVARALSHFQNFTYELNKRENPSAAKMTVNPFENLTQEKIRELASTLNTNSVFIIKLRDRLIEPDTIVSRTGFCREVAKQLDVPIELVVDHFKAAPAFSSRTYYKANEKPTILRREGFTDAVNNSGLSEKQKLYLLNL